MPIYEQGSELSPGTVFASTLTLDSLAFQRDKLCISTRPTHSMVFLLQQLKWTKQGCIHTMECSLAAERNKVGTHSATQISLANSS